MLDDSIIFESDCNENVQINFVRLISSANGKLNSKHLQAIYKSEYKLDVNFKPENIEVMEIKEYISENMAKDHSLSFSSINSFYKNASINLSQNDFVEVQCNNCSTPGNKNFKLLLNKKVIWLSGKLLLRRTAFVTKKDINAFNDKLSKSLFEESVIFSEGKEQLFTDLKNIHFYTANKKILNGKSLRSNDLSPLDLIKYGRPVKVILKSKTLSLRSSAVAKQAGKYGQMIELYNQKTKKKIFGRVVDFNTVVVEL